MSWELADEMFSFAPSADTYVAAVSAFEAVGFASLLRKSLVVTYHCHSDCHADIAQELRDYARYYIVHRQFQSVGLQLQVLYR